jgi:hypothetical protein
MGERSRVGRPAPARPPTDRHERAKDYLSPAEMARLLAADDPVGPLAMANLHTFAVTGPMSRECQKFATGPPISPPSDYYGLVIFFEPGVRNRPYVTVLQLIACHEIAVP